ncbi:hypothetical protein [Blastococcus sp. TF02-09]|uniref:hypothetical protein n=1 Tax=Blastococcus sp. TF02-09 TaxID=2250576 RepID=UPI0011BE1228|nr:hypothetical protein [Blastococcus sp. TF02-9]
MVQPPHAPCVTETCLLEIHDIRRESRGVALKGANGLIVARLAPQHRTGLFRGQRLPNIPSMVEDDQALESEPSARRPSWHVERKVKTATSLDADL